MTRFEQAVKIIGEDFKIQARDLECETCGEAIKIWGMDAKDLKEEFASILWGTDFWHNLTDAGEFIDEDAFYTYRQLSNAVRKYKFYEVL